MSPLLRCLRLLLAATMLQDAMLLRHCFFNIFAAAAFDAITPCYAMLIADMLMLRH